MERLSESLQQQAPGHAPDEHPSLAGGVLAAVRAEVSQHARLHGYLDRSRWLAIGVRLALHGVPQADRDELRAELARTAAEEGWVFPEELPPPEPTRRQELLVARARRQASRAPVITEGYLSALLALGHVWGLAHEQLAQELARCSEAEHWPADWELACGMEGPLGAERARQRLARARQQALTEFERRGQKGWLGEADQIDLYVGLREQGVSASEARGLLAGLRAVADTKGWACEGAWNPLPPTDGRLELLVDKVARQAARTTRVGERFRQAVVGEAAAAGIDQATLLGAIAERREREQWSASFSRRWRLPRVGRLPWWRRVVLQVPPRALSGGPSAALVRRARLLAPSVPRLAPLPVVLLAALSGSRPVAPPQPSVASAALVAPAAAVPAPLVPLATPEPRQPPATHLLLVAHTDGLGARLRTAPATGPVARLLLEGTAVVVIGTDVQVDGTDWKRVQAPDGTPGWMAADLLQPADGEPGGAA
jgi:hypothetical protein